MKLRIRKTSHKATFTQRGKYEDAGFVRIKGKTVSGTRGYTCRGELLFWPNDEARVASIIPAAVLQ